MVLLFDTENNKYYRFAGYRVPQFGELWLTTTNAILRQTLPIPNIQRDILREVEVLYQDKPGQQRKYE